MSDTNVWSSHKNTVPTTVSPSAPLRPRKYTTKSKIIPFGNITHRIRNIADNLFSPCDIPHSINDSYTEDYDIINLHNIILSKIEYEKEKLPDLNEKILKLQDNLKNKLKVIDRNKYMKEIEAAQEEIEIIKNEVRKTNYLKETKELLADYKRLGPIIKISSMTDIKEEAEDPLKDERLGIIRRYLDVAKQYFQINIVRIISNDEGCPGCGKELVFVDPEDFTLVKCEECGFERMNFIKPTFFREGAAKSTGGSDYEDKENFIKALECYLGEQQKPRDSLFQALDRWALSYGHPTKEEIRKLPLNSDGTRGDYNKSMLLEALANMGYADNYKDVKLIGHLQWDWKLQELSQPERDVIIKDYDATQTIFDSIPKTRKSSLNAQYRLFRHLEARGHNVKPSDFKIPASPSIIEEHDMFWSKMIKAIPGAKYVSLK